MKPYSFYLRQYQKENNLSDKWYESALRSNQYYKKIVKSVQPGEMWKNFKSNYTLISIK